MAGQSKGKVGVIGLGIMGGAFARHLAADGWQVYGIDTDPARCKAMAKIGVKISDHVKELAADAPVIITSLPNPAALHAVVSEIAGTKASPRIVVEASTFALDDKLAAEKVLRKAGHTMLDCPVSGTGAQAAVKDLVIYASGDKAAIEKILPVFAGFSRAQRYLGAFGNGSKMKYVANHLVTIHNVAAAEAIVLGIKAGLDPQMVYDVISDSAGSSRMFQVRGPMMVRGDYSEVTATSNTHLKDIDIIGSYAVSLKFPMPLFNLACQYYHAAVGQGRGQQDTAAVCAVVESLGGKVRGEG